MRAQTSMAEPREPSAAWSVLAIQADDPAPAYVQIERRVRVAVADGTLQPGARLPSVRAAASRLGLSTNTVARAYADLAREGVIAARAGGGSEIASVDRLDQPALARQREERLRTLARQVVVRGLALGLEPAEIAHAVLAELGARGHAVGDETRSPSLGVEEASLLSARNRLRGVVRSLRLGEMVGEVLVELPPGETLLVAATRASIQRIGLVVGGPVTAHVKATEPVLGP